VRAAGPGPVPGPVFLGAVLASVGGPLALFALYLPGAAGGGLAALGLTLALALLVFLAPLAVWLGFSERVASAGGLAAFVEAAAGRRLARIQALIWIVSYFLYLPYTITYIVYDLLGPVFPGVVAYRGWLEVLLPVAIVLLALAPLSASLATLGVVAVAQLAVVAVLGGLLYGHTGASSSALRGHVTGPPLWRGVGAVALLFVCISLPLFFAAEVRGTNRTVRRGLAGGYGIVAVFLLFAAIPLASVAPYVVGADLPGVAIAQANSGRALADVVALVAAASVAGLIVLELLALGRLLHWLFGTAIRPTLAVVAIPFVVADALSLIDPDRFYSDLIKPSLIALFASQLIVFLVYPLFRRHEPRRLPAALAVGVVASALAGYGLYTAITSSVGT
jgi:amino acid transporter